MSQYTTQITTRSNRTLTWSFEARLWFLLRLGVMLCFVGHGFWGLVHKPGWMVFFQVFGIGESTAYSLMPVIGLMDVTIGVLAFVYPNRAVIWYAAFWALFTATLRPSANMGMSEFYERAGNYGVPIAMAVLMGWATTGKGWFSRMNAPANLESGQLRWIERILRISLFSLLAGHGGLAVFMQHKGIAGHLEFLGLEANMQTMTVFGLFEIALAFIVLFKPRIPGLLFFILGYKLFTEMLHPAAGRGIDVFETIERGGDYVIPLMLWLIYRHEKRA